MVGPKSLAQIEIARCHSLKIRHSGVIFCNWFVAMTGTQPLSVPAVVSLSKNEACLEPQTLRTLAFFENQSLYCYWLHFETLSTFCCHFQVILKQFLFMALRCPFYVNVLNVTFPMVAIFGRGRFLK